MCDGIEVMIRQGRVYAEHAQHYCIELFCLYNLLHFAFYHLVPTLSRLAKRQKLCV
jgi:hypothetical protein